MKEQGFKYKVQLKNYCYDLDERMMVAWITEVAVESNSVIKFSVYLEIRPQDLLMVRMWLKEEEWHPG